MFSNKIYRYVIHVYMTELAQINYVIISAAMVRDFRFSCPRFRPEQQMLYMGGAIPNV